MELLMGALPSLLPKLGELLVGEYNMQKGLRGEIQFLQAELESMQGALEDISKAPAIQISSSDRIWAREVRELSYDIEDRIDTFMVRGKGSVPYELNGFSRFIDRSLGLLSRYQIRRNIATDIKVIRSRVDDAFQRRERNRIGGRVPTTDCTSIDPRLLTPYVELTELVGINEAREELIKILTEGDEVFTQHGKIASIVGFGGLGKTTLAKVVYEKLKAQFDCWAFVWVSQSPDMNKLFKGMLYQVIKQYNKKPQNEETLLYDIRDVLYQHLIAAINNGEALDVTQLIHELREILHKKRYLLVIDDIWDISVWNVIRSALPEDSPGYRIITTTRIFNVAQQMGSPYEMKPLCHEKSKILLYRRIFGNEYKETCPDEQIAEVSDRILKKCAGVPLAIITIASLLASKERNKMEWYNVCNLIGTGLENSLDLKNMRKILSLSYYDLPAHLRACLLYLTMFSEDYDIHKDRLIWMWIAEGFIQSERQWDRLFELGESYFNELINRSLIQPVYKDYYGIVVCCRAHDMVLDLIRSLSSEENFVTISNDVEHISLSAKVRRLSIQSSNANSDDTPWDTRKMQQVRSVVVLPSAISLMPALLSFSVLRVLDLHGCKLSGSYNLKYLRNLFNLRYLGLGKTRIAQLPEEIGYLQFLQTLDITGNKISKLPPTVAQLRRLMCLCIDKHTRVPKGIRNLKSLEKLSVLCIDHSMAIIEELGHLVELRVLAIECCTRWNINLEKSLVECLHKLKKIQSLFISFFGVCNLDAWVPPENFCRLELHGWTSTLPAWMMDPSCLLNLSFLDISFTELTQENIDLLGKLPALCYLWLVLDDENPRILVDRYVIGACLFPRLVEFVFWGFRQCVVFQHGAMPRLASLQLTISMREMRKISNGDGGFNLGLENLVSLQFVSIDFGYGSRKEVEEAGAALRRVIENHPNHPTLWI